MRFPGACVIKSEHLSVTSKTCHSSTVFLQSLGHRPPQPPPSPTLSPAYQTLSFDIALPVPCRPPALPCFLFSAPFLSIRSKLKWLLAVVFPGIKVTSLHSHGALFQSSRPHVPHGMITIGCLCLAFLRARLPEGTQRTGLMVQASQYPRCPSQH